MLGHLQNVRMSMMQQWFVSSIYRESARNSGILMVRDIPVLCWRAFKKNRGKTKYMFMHCYYFNENLSYGHIYIYIYIYIWKCILACVFFLNEIEKNKLSRRKNSKWTNLEFTRLKLILLGDNIKQTIVQRNIRHMLA